VTPHAPESPLDREIRRELARWSAAGLERRLTGIEGIDFCSNDYLALTRDERLIEAACAATRSSGAGAGAARLLGGESNEHAAAEIEAARWLGSEATLLLSSGWHANLAVLQTLGAAGDLILSDRSNHASLIDGARLARADVEVFAHNDPADLARRLRHAGRYGRRWIVCESVYSMDGSLAPLADYAALAEAHDAWLIVDEAHAAGLYGARGEGLAIGPALRVRVAARTVTAGKALGVAGAFLATSSKVRELLLQRGRAFVFTTAAPPGPVAAVRAAIDIVIGEPERRVRAHAAAARLRASLASRGVPAPGESPIVPIQIGDAERAVAVAGHVRAAGFDVRAVRPPTVAPGASGLRIVCHADHTPEQVDVLAQHLAAALSAAPTSGTVPMPAPELPAPLVVLGTDTDVGKTVVAALLCRAAARSGRAVRYTKLVQTGDDSDTEAVRTLADLTAEQAPAPLVALPLPASVDQAADAAGVVVTLDGILDRARERLAAHPRGCWIFETAGGLLVPFNAREDQSDLVVALDGDLDARVILVARSGLGTLNHTRLTLEALRRRGIAPRALFLVGPAHAANVRTLRTVAPGPILFEVPLFPDLATTALDAWLDTHDLEALLP